MIMAAIFPTTMYAADLVIEPAASILTGSQTVMFRVSVDRQDIQWSISPPIGTLSYSGSSAVYSAPSDIAETQTILVTASNLADSYSSVVGIVTLRATLPPSTNLNAATREERASNTRTDIASVKSNAGTLDVVVSALPNVAGGTLVNLSSATQDWRLYTQPVTACQSFSECYGDRRKGGSGIMGLHTNGTVDPNYYAFSSPPSAIHFNYSDGTTVQVGTERNLSFYVGHDHTIRATADRTVIKTLTLYYGLNNAYTSAPSKTGAGAATITISLTDGSVAPQVCTVMADPNIGNGLFRVTIRYSSATEGQELVVHAALNRSMSDGNTALTALASTLNGVNPSLVTRDIPMGADLQAEFNDMIRPGDVQRLPVGFTWTGNLILPSIPRANDAAGNPLRIRVQAADSNFASAKRVLLNAPTVVLTSPNTLPVLQGLGPGVAYWNFDGIRFASQSSDPWGLVYHLLAFGLASTPDHTTSTSSLPHDIAITHCVIHGRDPRLNSDGSVNFRFQQKGGILFDVLNGTIAHSNITNWVSPQYPNGQTDTTPGSAGGQEASAISIQAGKNIVIENNELSAQGEVVMMNSAYTGLSASEALLVPINGGLMPDTVTISANYIYKQQDWLALVLTKNLVECKTCKNVHITGNVLSYSFEGVYSDGQHGTSIAVMSRNGGGGDTSPRPYSWTRNVEVDHNIQHHQGSCVITSGPYDDAWTPGGLSNAVAAGMGRVSNINYHDNLCDDVSDVWTTPSTDYPTIVPGTFGGYRAMGARWGAPDNSTVRRNTFLFRETPNATIPGGQQYGVTYNFYATNASSGAGINLPQTLPNTMVNQVFDSNVFGWGDPACDSSSGSGCFYDAAHVTFTNNLLFNTTQSASSWNSFLNMNKVLYPGKWTGNTVQSGNVSVLNPTQGAPSTLAMGEAFIVSGRN